MRYLAFVAVAVLMTACAAVQRPMNEQNATLKSSNLTDVSVAAPAGTSPEGIQQMLYKVAAITTVKNGYDKFVPVDENAWKKEGLDKSLNQHKKENFNTQFAPNASMSIRMFRNGEPGSEAAIDARQYSAGETNTLKALKKIQ